VITVIVQQKGGTIASSVRLPVAERLGNAAIAYVAYIGKAFWPLHLAAYYPYPRSLPVAAAVMSGLLLLGALIGAILVARQRPYVLVGLLWYLGTLTPAIGIVQVGTQAMADRYTYIPLVGVFIILAWGIPDIVRGWSKWRPATTVVATAALIFCAVTARAQVRHWQSSETLWRHALDVTADNYAAHAYYGNALATRGDFDEAINHFNESIRIRPDYPEAHNNIGPALARQGKVDEAISHFVEAIRLRPGYAEAHSNLGVALATKGRFEEAIAQYSEALRLNPDVPNAHSNLGLALQATGKTAAAVQEFETALRMNPNNADARRGLAALQAKP
jgi:Flp pilus assembly protein TadD